MTRKLTKEQRDELAKTAPALYADWAHDLDEADRELEEASKELHHLRVDDAQVIDRTLRERDELRAQLAECVQDRVEMRQENKRTLDKLAEAEASRTDLKVQLAVLEQNHTAYRKLWDGNVLPPEDAVKRIAEAEAEIRRLKG